MGRLLFNNTNSKKDTNVLDCINIVLNLSNVKFSIFQNKNKNEKPRDDEKEMN